MAQIILNYDQSIIAVITFKSFSKFKNCTFIKSCHMTSYKFSPICLLLEMVEKDQNLQILEVLNRFDFPA